MMGKVIAAYERLGTSLRSILVFAIGTLALFLTMTRNANIFDEGIVLDGAMRVLDGQVTHIDFYSCYGPAVYWEIALLFQLTGPSMLAARLLGLVVAAAVIALAHALIAPRVRPLIALGISALLALWFMGIGSYLYPVYPCIALALAGALMLAGPGGAERALSLAGAGACAGLAALFRYDAGFFMMIGFILAAGAVRKAAGGSGRGGWRGVLPCALWIGTGAGLVFVPWAIAFLLPDPAAALAAFKADIIDYPLEYYGPMRGMPWPGVMDLVRWPVQTSVYLPLVVVAIALPMLRDDLRPAAREPAARVPAAIVLAALTVTLYYKGMVRVSPMHMLMAIAPAWALLGLLLERWTAAGRRWHGAAIAGTAALVLAGLTGLKDNLHIFRVNPRGSTWVWLVERTGLVTAAPDVNDLCPTWSGMRAMVLAPEYARTAWYLHRHSAPQDRVLAGLARTDRVFINPLLLGYAANRMSATHWSQYDPGLQNRLDVQQQMVRELAARDVRWVIRDTTFDGYIEPNGSSWHSGVNLLDDYVDAHYRAVGRAAGVSVWLRKDVAAPDVSRDPAECRLEPA